MTRIGIYTATENELGSIGQAAERLHEVELVVRSESDLDGEPEIEAFVEELRGADAAVFWLHGAEESMPGYEYATGALSEVNVPLIVKSTGDAFALEDTTVADDHRDRVYEYLERGGTVNVENCCRFLAAEYTGQNHAYDDPTRLPTEDVYHPDYPGSGTRNCSRHTTRKPTVAIWFYESHWTHENVRYVDAQVRALEDQGANALPIFCNPATDTEEQEDAEWVTDNWLVGDDGEPIVDAVLFVHVLASMDERGRSASGEGDSAEDVLDRLGCLCSRRSRRCDPGRATRPAIRA